MDELEFAIEKFGRDPEESESRRYYFGRLDKDPDAANTPEGSIMKLTGNPFQNLMMPEPKVHYLSI